MLLSEWCVDIRTREDSVVRFDELNLICLPLRVTSSPGSTMTDHLVPRLGRVTATVKLPSAFAIAILILLLAGCFSDGAGRPTESDPSERRIADGTADAKAPAQPADKVPVNAAQEDDAVVAEAENPLIRELQESIGRSEVFEETHDELQQTLLEADRSLSSVKQESLDALRQASRQVIVGSRPPNIILIVADDLGYGELGCYGQRRIRSPHLDDMASHGMRFTNFYAGGDTSSASWWCLMNGLYTARYGRSKAVPHTLDPQAMTLAEVLWQAGYDTEFIGNWSLAGHNNQMMPHLDGFDHWTGTLFDESSIDHYPEYVFIDGARARITANSDGQKGVFVQDFFTQELLACLERHRAGRPLFLVAAYSIPNQTSNVSLVQSYENEDWYEPEKARASAISQLDRYIGEIVDGLQAAGLDQQTAVFLTSDNAASKDNNGGTDLFDRSGGLRGHKGQLYEGGIRVPLIVRWPAQVPEGTTVDYPAAMWDLLPTFAELARAARKPRHVDGVSLVPVLRGREGNERNRLYWESRGVDGWTQAVRVGPWKVVRPAGKTLLGDIELYNLSDDPSETRNVASEHFDIVAGVVNKD